MKHILLIDDHAVMRQGLKQLLCDEFLHVDFGEAADSAEAMEILDRKAWDIAILDLVLPGRGGLDLLAEMKRRNPNLPILVYSMHTEEEFAIRALRSGASGYLSKSDVPELLMKAIRQILDGRKYVSDALSQWLVAGLNTQSGSLPHLSLSNREYEIMLMFASGKTTTEIANELSLSATTISTFRSRILGKMEMKSNAELIHYVIEHNLSR